MADVSKFVIDGTSYNLVDAVAQSNYTSVNSKVTQLENKVNSRSITYDDGQKAIVITSEASD